MRNVFTISGKEIRGYFSSPIAYLLLALFGLLNGVFFYLFVRGFIAQSMRAQMMGGGGPMSVNEMIIAPLLGNASVVGLFLIPLISMRVFAEEKRSGTIELLLTSPIHDWEIVLGKWFGAMFMYICVVAISAINIALLFFWSTPDFRPILTGFLGLLLQGGCVLAIGTFISNLTKNQIIAGAATFAICLVLWVLSSFTMFSESSWAQALAYCSILTHFEPFSKGIIDTKDVIFYVSAIFFGLFLTVRSLESLRWRA